MSERSPQALKGEIRRRLEDENEELRKENEKLEDKLMECIEENRKLRRELMVHHHKSKKKVLNL